MTLLKLMGQTWQMTLNEAENVEMHWQLQIFIGDIYLKFVFYISLG